MSTESFLTMIREGRNMRRGTHSYGGFDPDLHHSALAVVTVEHNDPHPPQVQELTMQTADLPPGGSKDPMEIMVHMMEQFDSLSWEMGSLWIESQQVYPAPNDTRATTVAKANDLLRLATLSGAAYGFAKRGSVAHIEEVLPAKWKQQRQKQEMWKALDRLMVEHKTVLVVNGVVGCGFAGIPKTRASHMQDAACLALACAGITLK